MKFVIALALLLVAAGASAQETFKLGIVSFLSGPAAESFGVPAVNGAKVVIEAFNKGAAPAPYNKVGFGGMKIEPVYVDENGGATKQVQELRNLYDREKVDAVVGYVGSGDCLAVAPVAEEMKKFLILYDCGTPRIFEDGKYNYVFRTAAHATMDNVALARYLKARNIKVGTINYINQDYAWGHDSRNGLQLADGAALSRRPRPAPTCCPSSAPASTAPRSRRCCPSRPTSPTPASGAATCRRSSCRPAPRGLFKRTPVRVLGRRPRAAGPRRQDARRRRSSARAAPTA